MPINCTKRFLRFLRFFDFRFAIFSSPLVYSLDSTIHLSAYTITECIYHSSCSRGRRVFPFMINFDCAKASMLFLSSSPFFSFAERCILDTLERKRKRHVFWRKMPTSNIPCITHNLGIKRMKYGIDCVVLAR